MPEYIGNSTLELLALTLFAEWRFKWTSRHTWNWLHMTSEQRDKFRRMASGEAPLEDIEL